MALTTHTLRYFDLQIEEGRGRDGGFLLLACGKIVVNAPQLFRERLERRLSLSFAPFDTAARSLRPWRMASVTVAVKWGAKKLLRGRARTARQIVRIYGEFLEVLEQAVALSTEQAVFENLANRANGDYLHRVLVLLLEQDVAFVVFRNEYARDARLSGCFHLGRDPPNGQHLPPDRKGSGHRNGLVNWNVFKSGDNGGGD